MPRVSFRVPGEINSNDLTVDSTTLTVDETNNRVGIVNASPTETLDVTGTMKASSGVITLTTVGTPSSSIADGALAVDTSGNKFFFRSGSQWREVSGTGGGSQIQTFTISGTLTAGVGLARWYAPRNITVSNVAVSVGSAPTGSSAVFDVLKNGSSMFVTNAKPTITAGAFTDLSSAPDTGSAAVSSGQYLTVEVVSVGSSFAGAHAVVQIEYS